MPRRKPVGVPKTKLVVTKGVALTRRWPHLSGRNIHVESRPDADSKEGIAILFGSRITPELQGRDRTLLPKAVAIRRKGMQYTGISMSVEAATELKRMLDMALSQAGIEEVEAK